MPTKLKLLPLLLLLLCFSCANNLENTLAQNWQVTKMERLVKVTTSNFSPIPVDIHPEMGYHLQANNKVALTTQMGSQIQGKWFLKDSVLSIQVENQTKEFSIQSLSKDAMQLRTGEFVLHLRPKN